MPKKKEAEAPAVYEKFDALDVTTKEPRTVVLMLNSSENVVVAKACESLNKYAEKSEKNKLELLNLSAVEPLLQHLQSTEKPIRAHAAVCLSSLSTHPDVRKLLRKLDVIPTLISLLSPDEGTVSQEKASLTLSNMAGDFTSKVAIVECNGVSSLVSLLSSTECDIQRNCVKTLSLLVEDYQGRAAVRDCQGLLGLIGLLESEYPLIQELILATLTHCSKDSETRESLRDIGALQKIIDFLQNKSYSDLHVHALHVLSNCLEDVATTQLLQSSGGLTSLLQFTQEATLPEVQQHAVRAIGRAARNADNRRIFHEQETEKTVIALLNSNHCLVASAAAVALAVMAESANCKDTITKEDGISGLVKLLSREESEAKEAALLALSTCTASSITNCRLVVDQGGLEHLVECLSHCKMSVQANAASCLSNLATDESSRVEIHQQETSIVSLLAMLESCDSVVQSRGASALASLLCDSECRVELRGHGGVSVLISLLHSANDDVRRSSGWALASCAVDPAIANEICALGGLDVLKELSESTSRQSQFTQLALDRLLDNCLPAKYWLTGQLSPTNIIEDGFYDMGRCYPGSRFSTLEDLCKQTVDQRRAILLINGRDDKPAATTVGQEADHEAKTGEVVSPQKERSQSRSKGGKGKKTKSDKDHDSHGRSEEPLTPHKPEELMPSWQPPSDPIFRSHIDHIRQNLLPLANAREQVEYLAWFVSDQMGGAVDRSSITSFSYELSISELKYELKSNVVPIGQVKSGTFYHRAILFKALADRVAISCSLVRGDYNRAWNVVLIPENPQTVGGRNVQFPPQKYVVDLMHHPGHLMADDSQEAVQYQHV